MYGNSGSGGKKSKHPAGYTARPRLGAFKNFYSSKLLPSFTPPEKRKKLKKSNAPKMEFRKKPDYADTAYREAVSRLRILLAESYTSIKRPLRELDSAGEETDSQSLISCTSKTSKFGGRPHSNYLSVTPRYHHYYPPVKSSMSYLNNPNSEKIDSHKYEMSQSVSAPPELMSFIERQEDYIEQLEKESKCCREELSLLFGKVKDLISENETLHEKQKTNLVKSVFSHLESETETETEIESNKKTSKSPKKSLRDIRKLEGPTIVFESRISELEAQLTEAKINLKKALEENQLYKEKFGNENLYGIVPNLETYKKQINNLQKEKDILQETISKLQNTLTMFKDKENDTSGQVKRSLDVAEQAQYEKNAADLEIRRLKDELERQHGKLRDAIAEQGRRISDERGTVERRYTQQIEQLTTELGVQWETTNKLQLELDKQRRENGDLRRELAQKGSIIDELKKDMHNKMITLQSDIGVAGAEKGALEQQIATLNIINERNERQAKQEIARLQAEMQSLRQRLDRADGDLIHSRRENIRLSEQIASLEKEINLNTALADERNKRSSSNEIMALPAPIPKGDDREKELEKMIQNMESKHAVTVAELEGMILSQNQLMDKLSTECHTLTQKLEDASTRHKEEIRELQNSLDLLDNRFSQSQITSPSVKDESHNPISNKKPAQPRIPSQEEIIHQQRNPNYINSVRSSRQNSREQIKSPPQQIQLSQNDNNTFKEYAPDNQYTNESIAENYGQQEYNQSYADYGKNSDYQNTEMNPQEYQQYAGNLDENNQQYAPDVYNQNYSGADQQYLTQEQYDQQYADQQYSVDPNQQYPVEPNQMYQTDPNQQYSDYANQEYSENPADQEYSVNPADKEYSKHPIDQEYSENPTENLAIDPNKLQQPIDSSEQK